MLRVESNTDIKGFTEFEEDILFDEDDPDFDSKVPAISVPFIFRDTTTNRKLFREKKFTITSEVSSNMSLASVHPVELHSSHSSLATLSHSLDDITGLSWNSPYATIHSDQVMTIEELRNQMTSCFTCGVSWSDHHVSLDCSECGGYAMERPCPSCDGNCGEMWKRDLTKTHATSKARWQGECRQSHSSQTTTTATNQDQTNTLVAQELRSRLENLSTHS